MNPTNREFKIVYSQEEMEQRIEQLKMNGYNESDIHVLARDKEVFDSYESQSNVDKQTAESFSSKFKSFFNGEDTVESQLKDLDLDQSTVERYSEDIKKGAILLYTDGQSLNRESDNFSSFGDDTRTVDSDESKRNTAFSPFGRDIERDGEKFNDEKIDDRDVKADMNNETSDSNSSLSDTIARDSERIYTTEVRREDQHGNRGYGDQTIDSRVKGENIHPTTDSNLEDETSLEEKSFDHEPLLETEDQQDDFNREDGVNRRQDEQSPGVDPNLGPAPFGRDSEEEHLLRDNNDNRASGDRQHHLDDHDETADARPLHEDGEKKSSPPPSPRLF